MNKIATQQGFLLDTHVWIWLSSGNSELTAKAVELIENAAQIGKVFIPAISIWEIAALTAKKRIILQTPLAEWIKEALGQPGIVLANMTPEIMIESAQLPNGFHGDPADRLIVATARVERIPLLTRDKKILEYSNQGYVQAYSV